MPTGSRRGMTLRFVQHALLFAALWWAISEGAPQSWMFGLPLLLALAGATCRSSSHSLSVHRAGPLLRLTGFFLVNSIVSGLDVARRALHPRLPMRPGLRLCSLRLQHPSGQVLLTNMLSLLPGTMTVDLGRNEVVLHVLDVDMPYENTVRQLEARIAAVFDETVLT